MNKAETQTPRPSKAQQSPQRGCVQGTQATNGRPCSWEATAARGGPSPPALYFLQHTRPTLLPFSVSGPPTLGPW